MALERSTQAPLVSMKETLLKGPGKRCQVDPTPSGVLRAAGILGLSTGLSRILGFGRDWLMAVAYGTSLPLQAFVVAFRIPNLFRDLVGEGAANTAFVPVFSRTRALEGDRSLKTLAQALWVRLVFGFLGVSLLGVIAAPWLVRIIAPGFQSDPGLLHLTVRLTRILFPFLGLVGLVAFSIGLLNSLGHFTLPSLGPALLNLCMIVGIFLWRSDALGLAWGVIVGGLLQLLVQWPALRRTGVSFSLAWRWHPGVGQIRQLILPRIVGTGVYQTSVLVDTIFASFGQLVGAGGVACLYFAHRFLHLPLALFGISLAQAALPTMAAQAATQDLQGIRRTCTASLRTSLLIAIPSSVGLIVLGYPIIHTLLEHGAFSPEATEMTVAALGWYALGLSAFCTAKVLANALYAFQDTWTPVRSATIALLANVGLNVALVGPMRLSGLALATSLSSIGNCLHLYRAVRGRIGSLGLELKGWAGRVLAASLGMAVVVQAIWRGGLSGIGLSGPWETSVWLLVTVASGGGSFFLLALLLRVEEVRDLAAWISRKG